MLSVMDFFARQDRARRQSGELVGLFAFSLSVVVVILAGVVTLIIGARMDMGAARDGGYDFSPALLGTVDWWSAHGGIFAVCAGVALAVILLGTLFKLYTLASGGGAVVARSMGADLVDANTHDPLQQRLRNVVEEIALASGVPVPAVYVMNGESAINAFAAGNTPADSVIAVTRGALEKLDRAELQGVVAHEFSHVLNGDTRLNMRLLGCVAGLFVIATIGRVLMRGRGRSAGGIALVGVAMFALGWIGVALGRLIQSAISRQREFLADASAVQFTRDTAGLRNALVKIAADGAGSRLDSHGAGEVAHMLFASGLEEVFATHPPIEIGRAHV